MGSVLPPDWDEVAPLIDAALDAPPAQRPALLLELSGGDPRRHADLVRLLAECDQPVPLLARPAAEGFANLFDDDDEAMPEVLGARYHIGREIGMGGMARVFLAQDAKHGRRVAVKVIRPELAASLGRERFLREIDIVARLRHPNIVPLYDSGDADGMLYFVMPYEDGPSLRACLSGGRSLSVAERVSVLRDVARALGYAHEQGVVHRDVKPDNVMLSSGAAVVTDFGISKAVIVARGGPLVASTLTQAGSGIGTPAYMAPEQAVGDPSTDHRADLYSFGCLAYELFTGNPPFHHMSAHQLIAAHVGTRPTPVREAGGDVPAGVAALIDRCLEKNPDTRPQSAQELLASLDGTLTGRGPRNPTPRWWLAGAAAAVLFVIAGWRLTASRRAEVDGPVQIAVLPFINVGGDPAQEYFADGMSIALTTALSKVPGLSLSARSLAFTYKGKLVDVRKVGMELGVSLVLDGTVQRDRNRLRITGQLTNVKDGGIRWSGTYDRAVDDLFTVQDNITDAIVGELRGRLTGATHVGSRRRNSAGTTNLDAYDHFMRGVYLLDRRGAGVAQAVGLFNEAIALDTAFAPAYATLSEALELLPYFTATPAASVEGRALAAAQHALALDATIPEAHVGLALLNGHAYRWKEAEAQFRLAMAADSSSAVVRMQYGRHLIRVGRLDDALTQLRIATRLDPLSATAFVWLAHVYSMLGRADSATAIVRHGHDVDPVLLLGRSFGALDLARAGHAAEARTWLAGLDASAPWMGVSALGLAATGDTAGALRDRRDLERLPRDTWMIHTALSYANLAVGDTARALSEMEASRVAREDFPNWLSLYHSVYDPVRKSARFAAIARSFGLPLAAQ